MQTVAWLGSWEPHNYLR